MWQSVRRSLFVGLFGLFALTVGGAVGLGTGSPAAVQQAQASYCEDDSCAETCTGDVCGGDCFHNSGSGTNCDEHDGTCSTTTCTLE